MDFEGVNVTADSQQLQVDSLQNPYHVWSGIFSYIYHKTSTIHVDIPFVPWMVCEKAYWIGLDLPE